MLDWRHFLESFWFDLHSLWACLHNQREPQRYCCICIHKRQVWFTDYDSDHEARVNVLNWCLVGEIDPTVFCLGVKLVFISLDCMNSQSDSCWSAEKTILSYEMPLHDIQNLYQSKQVCVYIGNVIYML